MGGTCPYNEIHEKFLIRQIKIVAAAGDQFSPGSQMQDKKRKTDLLALFSGHLNLKGSVCNLFHHADALFFQICSCKMVHQAEYHTHHQNHYRHVTNFTLSL